MAREFCRVVFVQKYEGELAQTAIHIADSAPIRFIVGTLIIGCRVIARRHDDPAAQQAGMQGRAPLASGIPSTSYTEAGPTLLARARNDRMPTRSLSLLGATRTARTKIPITGKSALPPFAEESTHRRHSGLAPTPFEWHSRVVDDNSDVAVLSRDMRCFLRRTSLLPRNAPRAR
jgi:hypothetical protein